MHQLKIHHPASSAVLLLSRPLPRAAVSLLSRGSSLASESRVRRRVRACAACSPRRAASSATRSGGLRCSAWPRLRLAVRRLLRLLRVRRLAVRRVRLLLRCRSSSPSNARRSRRRSSSTRPSERPSTRPTCAASARRSWVARTTVGTWPRCLVSSSAGAPSCPSTRRKVPYTRSSCQRRYGQNL